MSILRAKTIDLKQTNSLTELQQKNSNLNESESYNQTIILEAKPRRLVFELTNACNLNCIMCGRNSAEFKATTFDFKWTEKFENILNEVEEVTLMGWGEPTVHPNFVDFLYWAKKNGLRKYFCTNGMKLDKLFDDIFNTEADIIAISLDGASREINDKIRSGADFNHIIKNIRHIADEKIKRGVNWPYMNFVFTAMKSNLYEIPKMVRLAKDVGLQELKVVYLTVFDENMHDESFYDCQDEVKKVFEEAEVLADELNIILKLPHIQGEDSACGKLHKDCFTAWRDFFLGSDGFVRSCMSTPIKLFHIDKYKTFEEMWNSLEYKKFRRNINTVNMNDSCKVCYQSSFANWNKKSSFIQIGNKFSPEWDKEESHLVTL